MLARFFLRPRDDVVAEQRTARHCSAFSLEPYCFMPHLLNCTIFRIIRSPFAQHRIVFCGRPSSTACCGDDPAFGQTGLGEIESTAVRRGPQGNARKDTRQKLGDISVRLGVPQTSKKAVSRQFWTGLYLCAFIRAHILSCVYDFLRTRNPGRSVLFSGKTSGPAFSLAEMPGAGKRRDFGCWREIDGQEP